MKVTVNPVELASELAHNRTLYESGDICNNEDDMFQNINDDVLTYTEDIQDRFNEWYDYYLTIIETYTEDKSFNINK